MRAQTQVARRADPFEKQLADKNIICGTPDTVIKDFEKYNNEATKPLPGNWKGWIMIRANAVAGPTVVPPKVVGPTRGSDGAFKIVDDLREIYGGRWAKASIEAYYFNVGLNNGVTFGLRNVQLLKHDTRFGAARSTPEEDFEDASEEWAGQGDAFESGKKKPEEKDTGGW